MKTIDLFAGCGGMSLGFELANYNILFALEKDDWASETYAFNSPTTPLIAKDITSIDKPQNVLLKDMEVDGIIGGPPCQGFSLSGDRDPKDPRNSLFMDYLRFVNVFKPKFFVLENVPGILSSKTREKDFVHKLIKFEAEKIGYKLHFFTLNASHFGVPQTRNRVFFIGLRDEFPYDYYYLKSHLTPHDDKLITIEQAISDLPELEAGEGLEEVKYSKNPKNDYQRWCRKSSKYIYNHIAMKHTSRLIDRFAVIKKGQSLADVPKDHMQRKRGDVGKISGKIFGQNNMRPYSNKPSPTIAASFQSNFIHPYSNRNFTAREAARLQSFPDSYVFKGKRTTMSWEKSLSQYQQIGNAVPPLLAKKIGKTLMNYFNDISTIKDTYEVGQTT